MSGAASVEPTAATRLTAATEPAGNTRPVTGTKPAADAQSTARVEPSIRDILEGRLWRRMGLRDSEFEMVRRELGRDPNWTELGMFAVLWSEHCAYKHSRKALKSLPTRGSRVLVGPGENAGVVDIGDGLAVAFKMESHNHPSAVEPYQGAATGAGGIIRDILAMGARPIALMDPLRFGELDSARSRYLFSGVVSGIAGYGNCVGIPTVGGEVVFEDCYTENPLCNVMCIGLISKDRIKRGVAAGVGNSVMIVGHSTGRDGIHGATFASEELGEDSEAKRPNVQVGDPFVEKLLIEACLEMIATGAVVGIQDMGAAGITSSCAETAARAGTGIEIDVARVPLRENGMTPYEIMLSESQERMLVIVEKGRETEVEAICRKWGLPSSVIGRVTSDGAFRVLEDGRVAAEVPAVSLADRAPVYDPPWSEPEYLTSTRSFDPAAVPVPVDLNAAFRKVLCSPTIACKAWVYRQYDHMVQTNTVALPGADAAVLRIRRDALTEGGPLAVDEACSGPYHTGAEGDAQGAGPRGIVAEKAIAISTDGNGRFCYLDPVRGAEIAVAEAARNVACSGARPIAITNCLNFGNPEKPEVFWQFRGVIEGMRRACEALDTPVTGGNVSFYNESRTQDGVVRAIYPTPVIGMVGLLDNVSKMLTPGFKSSGDLVVLLGRTLDELGGTEYLKAVHGKVAGEPPHLDLDQEKRLLNVIVQANDAGLLKSAHDVSDGGLSVALAECCFAGFAGARGAEVLIGWDERPDSLLFSETQSRVVVTVEPGRESELVEMCREAGVPCSVVGRVTSSRLRISAFRGGAAGVSACAWGGEAAAPTHAAAASAGEASALAGARVLIDCDTTGLEELWRGVIPCAMS